MQSKNRDVRKFNLPQQLIPLGILFIAALVALIVVRHFLVPPTFGEYGHYRATAIDDNLDKTVYYAGFSICADCHDDISDMKAGSNHHGVSCEVCHGPAAKHIEDPTEFTPEAPRSRGFCPLCHEYDPARPSGFPQIIEINHNPGQACITCHNPHEPVPPHTPEECNACHRDIANQKSVSHHATLKCTKCHQVPQQHLIDPQSALAQKPKARTLCGQCHAKGADSPKTIPRIDMDRHGERYLCWDCHYPHHPEAL